MAEEYRTVQHDKPFRYEEGGYQVTRGCAWTGPGRHLGGGVIMTPVRTDVCACAAATCPR